MIKAVLLDLDDTLLQLDLAASISQYMRTITTLIADRHPALAQPGTEKALRGAVRAAMQAMIHDLDPTCSNRQLFVENLAANLGLPIAEAEALVDTFHAGAYQAALDSLVQPLPGAAALVSRLFRLGLAVVIATNPLYPLNAIHHRMTCARLPLDLPYAFITNMDETHFAKPHPHFYEEILARIGVEADEAIMVGDRLDNDIVPAAQVGMFTFWVDQESDAAGNAGAAPYHGRGSLLDFARQVENGWLADLGESPPAPRTAAQVAPRLVGNAGALFGMVEALEPRHWQMRPDPAEWSPLEIVCHLRDSEREVQRPRLQQIAAQDNPFISPPPAPPGPGECDLSGKTPLAAAHEFWAERRKTLAFLAALDAEAWQRPARHSIFGPTSLLEMAHFTARHDRLHLTQLCQTIGRCQQGV